MIAPVYVYYQLDNFYQNHRRYVKSRDYKQLMGENRTLADITKQQTCDPVYTNADVNPNGLMSVSGLNLSSPAYAGNVAIPCGLIAKSVFNDTFKLSTAPFNGTTSSGLITIDSSNIAWKSDVDYKFFNQPGNWQDVQWLNITDCKDHYFNVFRTFHCLDANCWSSKLPKALRCHQLRS